MFGVWADVAPDKFVLMLQGFKTGGCLGALGLTLAWLVTEKGFWVMTSFYADGLRARSLSSSQWSA